MREWKINGNYSALPTFKELQLRLDSAKSKLPLFLKMQSMERLIRIWQTNPHLWEKILGSGFLKQKDRMVLITWLNGGSMVCWLASHMGRVSSSSNLISPFHLWSLIFFALLDPSFNLFNKKTRKPRQGSSPELPKV